MRPLNTIIFIDDNRGDNVYHRIILEELGISAKAEMFQLAENALAYIRSQPPNSVDLIFLDINMPRMNGFEFLDEYQKINSNLKARAVIVMLTTSCNPADEARARQYRDVKGFLSKPLTEEILQGIIQEHFSDEQHTATGEISAKQTD